MNTGTFTSNSNTYLYTDVPNGMHSINSSTLTADTLTGNYPFRANGQKQKAWLSYMPYNGTDTFAVSTSWLNPAGTAAAFLITPAISSITINSILSWASMSPDLNNADGFEVYAAINTTNTPVPGDFTTLLFSTSSEKNTWQTHGVSLASFAGQTIRIAFKNNSTNKYQLWLDDILVKNITNAYDVAAVSQNIYKYSSINSNNIMSATFKNNGYTAINTLTLKYMMGNGSTVTETKILSPPLNYLESRTISFTQPYNSSTALYTSYKIWAELINGQMDQVKTDDTITGSITVSSSVPPKKVLLEEFTGAWCGWCPDSYTTLKSVVNTNTNVIAASIHDNDNMSTAEGNTLIADYTTTFPSATIDQYYFSPNEKTSLPRENWNTYIAQRLAMKTPATVTVTNISYNSMTRQIDATVSTTFLGDVKGDYRLNLYIKENNVYGPVNDNTDNQWNQHSYLFNIGSSPYYQMGTYLNPSTNILNTSEYTHQNVVNNIADGAYGSAGIIPSNATTNGLTFSKTYTYTLPSPTGGEFRYNADNIYLIGTLSEYSADIKNRSILNAAEVKLTSNSEVLVSVKEFTASDMQLNVFPNPAHNFCYLTYNLKQDEFVKVCIYNALGELVSIETKNVNAGNVSHTLDVQELPSGNYSIQVSFKNNIITKKLTIIK
ncbi:MAG: T9SS type A sorting domain-containing protein [Bacteroidota bacterium]